MMAPFRVRMKRSSAAAQLSPETFLFSQASEAAAAVQDDADENEGATGPGCPAPGSSRDEALSLARGPPLAPRPSLSTASGAAPAAARAQEAAPVAPVSVDFNALGARPKLRPRPEAAAVAPNSEQLASSSQQPASSPEPAITRQALQEGLVAAVQLQM